MNKLIVLNHKMNLEYDQVVPYIERINNISTENSLVICPSNIYLSDFVNLLLLNDYIMIVLNMQTSF